MPADGFPLVLYFHGSGGLSTALADRGTWVPTTRSDQVRARGHARRLERHGELQPGGPECVTGCNTPGEGPAYVLAPFGIAMAGSALPVNPERLPGASRHGVPEPQQPRRDARHVPPGHHRAAHLPRRAREAHDRSRDRSARARASRCRRARPATSSTPSNVLAQGQSMGGMYTNLISAAEPRIRAARADGRGRVLEPLHPRSRPLIPDVAGQGRRRCCSARTAKLTFLHPGLNLFETGDGGRSIRWSRCRASRAARCPATPCARSTSRWARATRTSPRRPTTRWRSPTGTRRRATSSGSTMQDALKLEGRDGLLPYPVANDLTVGGRRRATRASSCSTRATACTTRTRSTRSSTR